MTDERIPFDRYPGLAPLFLDFVRGASDLYPDPPTAEAAARRASEILGTKARVPAEAWTFRGDDAAGWARSLAEGRAVASVAGHQVGLFTGPLYTLTKAFDAMRSAGEIASRGVPAAAAFWALTDDHDLEEIARSARPGPRGAEVLVLEGADRSNRKPVGALPLPEKIREVLEAFRADAKAPDAEDVWTLFASRYTPGVTYARAFIETLLDLVDPEPLLVLDPSHEGLRDGIAEFFRMAVERRRELGEALRLGTDRVARTGREATVPFRPDVFPFFLIEEGERRRVADPEDALRKVEAGTARPSADVLTRPVLKSFLIPTAASVLGPAEIAYHAQVFPLYDVFGIARPVLLPRSHLVLMGPRERRAAEALHVSAGDVLAGKIPASTTPVPQANAVERLSKALEQALAGLEPELAALDPSLPGALETTRKKASYPLARLSDGIRKAAERKDATTQDRKNRLETMLRPGGTTGERVYPPLVPMLAHGRAALSEIRRAAVGSIDGARVVNLGAASTDPED